MMKKRVYVFLFEGFSDWELAYLTPEICKSEAFELVYFSKDGKPVLSMGGMHVLPNLALADVSVEEVAMLILPGGVAWEKGELREIDGLVKELFTNNKPIAAICGATIYLAQQGFLDSLKHTSNDLGYLKAVAPAYLGEKHYLNEAVVTDGNIITANGISPIEFAREIFTCLRLMADKDIERWYQLFKNGVWCG